MPLPKGSREPFGKASLLVVDVALVDRIWSAMPAMEAIARVAAGPVAAIADAPGLRADHELKGLDVALRDFTTKKLAATQPLVANLRAKRALTGWRRWFTTIPDAKEEQRVDDRLHKLAEVTRLAELAPEEIMTVGSIATGEMVGAAEVGEMLARLPALGRELEAARAKDARAALLEAWDDDLDPLLAATGADDEAALVAAAAKRVGEIAAIVAFAAARSLTVLPWSAKGWPAYLQERARTRGA